MTVVPTHVRFIMIPVLVVGGVLFAFGAASLVWFALWSIYRAVRCL